jgi:hypothetical protein
MSPKIVTEVVMTMVSLLRLKGYGGQAGFSVQVSVRVQGSKVQG